MSTNLEKTQLAYQSIFWSDDWAHTRFYGWQVESEAPGFRALKKKAGPFVRNLVLLSEQGRSSFVSWLENGCSGKAMRQITVHDFSKEQAEESRIGTVHFVPCDASQRMLNIATSVIDLTPDSEVILGAMSTDYRRKVRKAESSGVEVTANTSPTDELCRSLSAASMNSQLSASCTECRVRCLGRCTAAGTPFCWWQLCQMGRRTTCTFTWRTRPGCSCMVLVHRRPMTGPAPTCIGRRCCGLRSVE